MKPRLDFDLLIGGPFIAIVAAVWIAIFLPWGWLGVLLAFGISVVMLGVLIAVFMGWLRSTRCP